MEYSVDSISCYCRNMVESTYFPSATDVDSQIQAQRIYKVVCLGSACDSGQEEKNNGCYR